MKNIHFSLFFTFLDSACRATFRYIYNFFETDIEVPSGNTTEPLSESMMTLIALRKVPGPVAESAVASLAIILRRLHEF